MDGGGDIFAHSPFQIGFDFETQTPKLPPISRLSVTEHSTISFDVVFL